MRAHGLGTPVNKRGRVRAMLWGYKGVGRENGPYSRSKRVGWVDVNRRMTDVIWFVVGIVVMAVIIIAGVRGHTRSAPEPDVNLELMQGLIRARIQYLQAQGNVDTEEYRYLVRQN
jgi:hypothetical protein